MHCEISLASTPLGIFSSCAKGNPSRVAVLTGCVLLALSYAPAAYADTFGSGLNSFDIEFVTIGDPGNPANGTDPVYSYGSVPYEYGIGKFEISEDMINKANAATAATANPLNITHDGRGVNKPATSINWFEAAIFVNWLNTSTGNPVAYELDDDILQTVESEGIRYFPENLLRNSQTRYVLPNFDEWYKAAAYEPGSGGNYFEYSTGSDTPPTAVASGTAANTAVFDNQAGPADITLAGGLSAAGTMGQGGNVREWIELKPDYDTTGQTALGGSWISGTSSRILPLGQYRAPAGFEGEAFGFRVAVVPEPSSLALGALVGIAYLLCNRRLKNRF